MNTCINNFGEFLIGTYSGVVLGGAYELLQNVIIKTSFRSLI